MSQYVFHPSVFELFNEPTLDGRMQSIKQVVQPIFKYQATQIAQMMAHELQLTDVPVHVAKHLRRTVHPPMTTWVAIGGDKRGYKRYPHFQIGLTPDYVFIMLAVIDQPIHEQAIAQLWQSQVAQFEQLPKDYCVIPDHTELAYLTHPDIDYAHLLQRLSSVKKAEFMIGRIAHRGASVLSDEVQLTQWLQATVKQLLPYYVEAMQFYQ